jgi:hypothetical protein
VPEIAWDTTCGLIMQEAAVEYASQVIGNIGSIAKLACRIGNLKDLASNMKQKRRTKQRSMYKL